MPTGLPRLGRWRSALSVAVVLTIACFLGKNLLEGWSSVQGRTWHLDPVRALLSLGVLTLYYPLLVWNWCYLMRQLGQPIPLRTALPIWLGSQLGKFLPGKVWTMLGRVYLAERAGLDAARVSLTLLIEVGLIVVTGILLAAATVSLGGDLPIRGRALFLALLVPGLVALHPKVFCLLVRLGLRILRRPEVAFSWSTRSHVFLVASFLLSWVLYGAAFYLFATSLSITQPNVALFSWVGFMSVLGFHTLSWIAGFLAFLTPGGLGVREASLAFFLGSLMPSPVATLVALLARLWITLAELVAIGLGLAVGRVAAR